MNKLIVLLCLTVIAARFAVDSYLPSLPAIASYFSCTDAQAQLTLTFYLLGFGGSQFIYGPLSDAFGRRKIMLLGSIIFVLSGVMCTISTSISFLIISRLFAGIGTGAGSTLSRAILSDVYEKTDIAKKWAQITSSLMMSLMIAPIIGSYVQEDLGWRYNFLFSTTFAALILILLYLFLHETKSTIIKIEFKQIIRLYLELIANIHFIGYILCSTLSFAGLSMYFQLSPFIFIGKLGLTPSIFGWLTFLIAICYMISGIIVNYYIKKASVLRMLSIGITFLILGGALMLLFSSLALLNVMSVLIPAVLYVIGARIVIPNATAGSLSLNKNASGSAAALVGGIQMIGSSLLSYIVTKMHFSTHLVLALVFITTGIVSMLVLNALINKEVNA